MEYQNFRKPFGPSLCLAELSRKQNVLGPSLQIPIDPLMEPPRGGSCIFRRDLSLWQTCIEPAALSRGHLQLSRGVLESLHKKKAAPVLKAGAVTHPPACHFFRPTTPYLLCGVSRQEKAQVFRFRSFVILLKQPTVSFL